MKLPVVLLIVLTGGAAALARAEEVDALRRFEQANQAFLAAQQPPDYLDSAALYESILADGVESGAVLFNLGNAYQRAGERGRAIAAYRRAERLRPRDPLLQSNLDQALGGATYQRPDRRILDTVFFWQGWLSTREKAWLMTILGTLAIACGFLRLLGARPFRTIGLCFGGLFLIALASLLLDRRDAAIPHGVVVADKVAARKGSAESYAEAFTAPLVEGDSFIVLERSADWLRVRVGGDLDGWIQAGDAVLW